jgi:hypothetical protein
MGFVFRKSFGAGPFRVNLSKSGVGYSVGGRGFRTGISANGRRYSSFGVPGTGLSYRTSKGSGSRTGSRTGSRSKGAGGCMVMLVVGVGTLMLAAVGVGAVIRHANVLGWLK